jgi:hypothetical protein
MAVEEIQKPGYQACAHVNDRGCSIYNDRPSSCRDFSCLWLQDPGKVFRNMERPDRIGIMFDVTLEDGKIGQALVAREVRKGAFHEPDAVDLLAKLSKRVLIITVEQYARGLIGPAHLVEQAKRKMLRVVED